MRKPISIAISIGGAAVCGAVAWLTLRDVSSVVAAVIISGIPFYVIAIAVLRTTIVVSPPVSIVVSVALTVVTYLVVSGDSSSTSPIFLAFAPVIVTLAAGIPIGIEMGYWEARDHRRRSRPE